MPPVSYYTVKSESRTLRRLQFMQSFVLHFLLLGKTVALIPSLENFRIRQTMCDTLIVTFSNMATNDQAIVNPPASFMSAVWKYYGFLPKDGTTHKSKTICKIGAGQSASQRARAMLISHLSLSTHFKYC